MRRWACLAPSAPLAVALRWASFPAFSTYANQYTKPFNEVTGVLTQMQTALASAGRLLDVIDQTPETPDAPDALAPAACEGRVDVEDVCFSYTRRKYR